MSSRPGKTEFRLSYDDRGGVVALSGDVADAQRIQNVLFGQPRADDAQFGVDLRSYLMEIADQTTLEEIRARATNMINRYCPGIVVRGMLLEYLDGAMDPTGGGGNALLFGLSLGSRDSGNYDFALVASRGSDGRVVSRLVL